MRLVVARIDEVERAREGDAASRGAIDDVGARGHGRWQVDDRVGAWHCGIDNDIVVIVVVDDHIVTRRLAMTVDGEVKTVIVQRHSGLVAAYVIVIACFLMDNDISFRWVTCNKCQSGQTRQE